MLLVLLPRCASLGLARADRGPIHRVLVEADASGRDAISTAGLDIADDADLLTLSSLGLRYTVLETRPGPRALGATGEDGPLPDTKYHDPAEVEAILQQTAVDHPDITRLVSLGTTYDGRDIWALMISDNANQDEDELSNLFNAAHHAREVMTPEILLDTIEQLTDLYGSDAEITGMVNDYQIWCVPIVNPDGVAIVHEEDDFWRKNARDNDENGTINSSDGVDPKRNYEWGWGFQCRGSSSSFTSAIYRAPPRARSPRPRR